MNGAISRDTGSLPFSENFEGSTFPPTDWQVYDQDGMEPAWSANTTHNHTPGGSGSAMHLYDASSQEGWLVTPLIELPSGTGIRLSFWSYNVWPGWYGNNAVMVSTTSPDPDVGNYTGIWSPITVSDSWVFNMVDLSPWQGQSVYIAFRYQGNDAHNWYLDDVMIEEYSGIHEFPFCETFESGVFPPYYWLYFDMDESDGHWNWNQYANQSNNGTCSAMHLKEENNYSDDWLITPLVRLPADVSYSVSFWSFNENPQAYGTNSVWISTGSLDPNDGDFEEVWTPRTVTDSWVRDAVDLSNWMGQNIYIAFRYEGMNAHDWYLDDVFVYETLGDTLPPTIIHQPVLNTTRNDLPITITAEVHDDLIWNSGLSYVGVYYALNGSGWIWLDMSASENGYTCEIPAQPYGTQVYYVIVAQDGSLNNNITYSPGYTVIVDNPVWLYYDSLTQNTWAGWNDGDWGLGVLYANPMYGTGNPLQVSKVSAAFRLADTVNLQVFACYEPSVNDLTPLMDPMEVSVYAEEWIEITLDDVLVDTPYFYIRYDGIDAYNGFAADTQRYYPGRNYIILGDNTYELGEVGFNAVWMLRAYVQTTGGLAVPELSIENRPEGLVLSWTAVDGATSYAIYASADPNLPIDEWGLFDRTTALELGALGDFDRDFFFVRAETDVLPMDKNMIMPPAHAKTGQRIPLRIVRPMHK